MDSVAIAAQPVALQVHKAQVDSVVIAAQQVAHQVPQVQAELVDGADGVDRLVVPRGQRAQVALVAGVV